LASNIDVKSQKNRYPSFFYFKKGVWQYAPTDIKFSQIKD